MATTHSLPIVCGWERAAFGYSDDGRQAKALPGIIDGDDEGDDDDGDECGCHEYGGK